MPAGGYRSARGPYELGPANAKLMVATHREGFAARAGHDLVLEVTSWRATLTLGDEGGECSATLAADPLSLRVREGRGGAKPLSRDDRAEIERRIVESVLGDGRIEFRSSAVEHEGGLIRTTGALRIRGVSKPVSVQLEVADDGRVEGAVAIEQSAWGIEPYSALMGALRVSDAVEVSIRGRLTAP